MQIEIKEEAVQAAMIQCTEKALAGAMNSYEIERTIREKVVEAVVESAIAEVIADSIRAMDLNALHQALAAEMSRQIQKGACAVIQEAVIESLMGLRKIPTYDDEARKRTRAEIEAKLRREG